MAEWKDVKVGDWVSFWEEAASGTFKKVSGVIVRIPKRKCGRIKLDNGREREFDKRYVTIIEHRPKGESNG